MMLAYAAAGVFGTRGLLTSADSDSSAAKRKPPDADPDLRPRPLRNEARRLKDSSPRLLLGGRVAAVPVGRRGTDAQDDEGFRALAFVVDRSGAHSAARWVCRPRRR